VYLIYFIKKVFVHILQYIDLYLLHSKGNICKKNLTAFYGLDTEPEPEPKPELVKSRNRNRNKQLRSRNTGSGRHVTVHQLS
jgi:hypothetical protein